MYTYMLQYAFLFVFLLYLVYLVVLRSTDYGE